jgi:hypothetical protein
MKGYKVNVKNMDTLSGIRAYHGENVFAGGDVYNL